MKRFLILLMLFAACSSTAQMTQRYHCWDGWGRGVPHRSICQVAMDFETAEAKDWSGNGHDGSVGASVTYSPPNATTSGRYTFPGGYVWQTATIQIPNGAWQNMSPRATISLQMKTTTSDIQYLMLFNYGSNGGTRGWAFYISDAATDDMLTFYMYPQWVAICGFSKPENTFNGPANWQTGGVLLDNANANNCRMYTNGVFAAQSVDPYNTDMAWQATSTIYIGGQEYCFPGALDNIYILNDVISAAEFKAFQCSLMHRHP